MKTNRRQRRLRLACREVVRMSASAFDYREFDPDRIGGYYAQRIESGKGPFKYDVLSSFPAPVTA